MCEIFVVGRMDVDYLLGPFFTYNISKITNYLSFNLFARFKMTFIKFFAVKKF